MKNRDKELQDLITPIKEIEDFITREQEYIDQENKYYDEKEKTAGPNETGIKYLQDAIIVY